MIEQGAAKLGKAVLIVNARSRRGREWLAEAEADLRELGFDLETCRPHKNIKEVRAATLDAIRRKVPLVIVGGGDGTFSAVARYFVHSDSVMGVLPLGTGNQFARDLGIEANVRTACEVIAGGNEATVDLGIAADDYFLNVATVGVTTQIAKELTVDAKRRFGRFVYVLALVRALQKTKPFRLRLDTENGVTEFDTLQVVIGNGKYHAGPFPISPTASITEGKLSLYALHNTSRAAFLKMGLLLPTGRHVDLPDVHSEDTVGGLLTTQPALPVTIDGEVSPKTPLKFGVLADCLRVRVPFEFEG